MKPLCMVILLSAARIGLGWVHAMPLVPRAAYPAAVAGPKFPFVSFSRLSPISMVRMVTSDECSVGAKKLKILIADQVSARAVDDLRGDHHVLEYAPDLTADQLQGKIEEFQPNLLVVRSTVVKKDALAAAKCLQLVVRAGAGVDNIDLAAAKESHIAVANCPGANSAAVAELTWALILACDRNIVSQSNDLKNGQWKKGLHALAKSHKGIAGRTMGIVGFGSIGKQVALRAQAFGMKINVWSRSTQEAAKGPMTISDLSQGLTVQVGLSLDELAAVSDVVCVHLASSAATDKLLGNAFFDRMKDEAIFVNVARGSVVDEEALLEAVSKKGLKVGLDVYANEPKLPAADFDCKIAKHPNVITTHHVGAGTLQAEEAVTDKMLQIIHEYAATGQTTSAV